MNWKAFLAGAVGSALLAGAASAGTVDVSVYNGYNDNGAGVTFAGPVQATGTINAASTGFDYNWNAPGSIGGYNAGDVFSADFTGALDVASGGNYTVQFGSDDAGYVFINGALAISDGGEHGFGLNNYTVALNAGVNNFEIQYGNGPCCGAEVALEVDGSTVSVGSVPEPASWAMMILGLGAIGGVLRSRRKAALSLA